MASTVTVFISYSHESAEHKSWVRELANRLRERGIDASVDQDQPRSEWMRWVLDELDRADRVLLICSETYYRCFRGQHRDRGANFETQVILNDVAKEPDKYIPIIRRDSDRVFIWDNLRDSTHYCVSSWNDLEEVIDRILASNSAKSSRTTGKPVLTPETTSWPDGDQARPVSAGVKRKPIADRGRKVVVAAALVGIAAALAFASSLRRGISGKAEGTADATGDAGALVAAQECDCVEREPPGLPPPNACHTALVSIDPADTMGYDRLAEAAQNAKDPVAVKRILCEETKFKKQWRACFAKFPGAVFSWPSGKRANVAGMEETITIWNNLSGASKFHESIEGDSGKFGDQYHAIPFRTYPWLFYYKKGTLPRGARPPGTWKELIALLQRMAMPKDQGGIGAGRALGFSNEDGWQAMGTFDILDMRMNGFEFHRALMTGAHGWNTEQVRAVFRKWAELIPYYGNNWRSKTTADVARDLAEGKVAFYFIGSFFMKYLTTPEAANDFDVFEFPALDDGNGLSGIDAPIDGFVFSKGGDKSCAEKLLKFIGSDGFEPFNEVNPLYLTVTPGFTSYKRPIQNAANELLKRHEKTHDFARFMDREMDPDLADQVVKPALAHFLEDVLDGVDEQKIIRVTERIEKERMELTRGTHQVARASLP